MEFYKPSDDDRPERLVLSNMQYGLLRWFYNRGHCKVVPESEALLLDQRSFGPAVARGLLAYDGKVWYMTEAGRVFMQRYEGRDPWKETHSRQYSHYIKAMRLFVVRENRRAKAAGENAAIDGGRHRASA